MTTFLSIDDTDNHDSPGSGQLAETLAEELQQLGLATLCSPISRHQLYLHADIPYTSHNSSMCFSAEVAVGSQRDLISHAQNFLRERAAPGSDPGLCVASDEQGTNRQLLSEFGLQAKRCVLTKQQAYDIAHRASVHLSEHGGSGDGVIGALAGIGLRMDGNDGRFRGWLRVGNPGRTISVERLCAAARADRAVDESGRIVPGSIQVSLVDEKVKTILCDHRRVIPLARNAEGSHTDWSTLTRAESKRF